MSKLKLMALTAIASGGRLSFRGFCGTYEVEATSNGRTVKRQFHVGRENPRSIGIMI